MQTLQVRVYESLEALQGLLPAWEELLSEFPTATIFSTWEWLAPWWRAFGNGQRLMVLGFFDTRQRLAGLAPLSLSTYRVARGLSFRVLRLMGDGSGDSDNLDLPVRPGYEEEFVRTLLDYTDAHESCWDFCEFNTMPSDSLAGNTLISHLKQRGWTFMRYQLPWSVLDLPDSWDRYLKRASPKERDNLRYYQRRLERRYQTRFYKCTEERQLPACLDTLFQLHQARWQPRGQPGSFGSEQRRQFYSEMGPLFLARRWLEFWLLELNGKPAAAQFSFRYRETVYALQQGFDPEFGALSVQDVLRAYVLQQLIAQGVRRYDMLAGRDIRKDRWGAKVGYYMNIHFAEPFSRGSLYLHLSHNAREGKAWLRAHFPRPAWRALQWLNSRVRGA